MGFFKKLQRVGLVLGMWIGGGVAQTAVVVSSKIDSEGALLGSVIAQVLEAHGVEVVDKIQLGASNIVRTAILGGEIDVYPEYTGNGAYFSNSLEDAVWRDLQAGYERVRAEDAQAHDLVWLEPAKVNNTWAIAVNAQLYREGVRSFADLVHYLSDGGAFKLAASAEFVESPLALPTFEKVYGFELDESQLLVLSGGNTSATIQAAARGTNGVNAAMVYATDGALAALDLHVLADDQQSQVVYAPAVVVRGAVAREYPELQAWFAPVFARLDLQTLQALNARILLEGVSASVVASEFLATVAH